MGCQQTKYGKTFERRTVERYIRKKKNDVYKLLPLREEEGFWKEHLQTVAIEMNGCSKLFIGSPELIEVCAKLEALMLIDDFMIYRKTIFEILSCLDRLEGKVNE